MNEEAKKEYGMKGAGGKGWGEKRKKLLEERGRIVHGEVTRGERGIRAVRRQNGRIGKVGVWGVLKDWGEMGELGIAEEERRWRGVDGK